MNRYMMKKHPTVKTPVDLSNMDPKFHNICKSIHSLRGLEISGTGKMGDGTWLVFFFAKNIKDIAPLVRATDNRYGGHISITITCECIDIKDGINFCLRAPEDVFLNLVSKNIEFLKHDDVATNSRKFLEVEFSE